MPPAVTPVLLLILDGFGLREAAADNAITLADAPCWRAILAQHPHTRIEASGPAVGLPEGQFGNSEVGHLNIGAGRVLLQDISKVDVDVAKGCLGQNPQLEQAFRAASKTTLHVMGLVSDGGVHSHQSHIHALIRDASAFGLTDIAVHAFLDGRDTPPQSAAEYLRALQAVCDACPGARIVSVTGRYYAMDRDNRWERVEPAWRVLVEGEADHTAPNALAALDAAYARGETDEFVSATAIRTGDAHCLMKDGDAVVFMNFRADRAREISMAIAQAEFGGFARRRVPKVHFCTLTSYADAFDFPVAYPKEKVADGLGEVLAKAGLAQLRIAETEKYPHVTYFFSGGEEQPFEGENRVLVPSPKVTTYDLAPAMSAAEVTDKVEAAIQSGRYAAIVCNFANADMVGHTGNLAAAVAAIEAIDPCIARCVAAMQAAGGEVIITADHGNAEQMWDVQSGQPHTQHTCDPVPFVYVGRPARLAEPGAGALRDIAPSMLQIMGLPQPAAMTGRSLIEWI